MTDNSGPVEEGPVGDDAPKPALPSVGELCLDVPLYREVEPDQDLLKALRAKTVQFDAYCIHCGKETTFRDNIERRPEPPISITSRPAAYTLASHLRTGFFVTEVFCQRNIAHAYRFCFHFTGKKIYKYGQTPSLEDIAGADIQKFRKVMPTGFFGELKRATGLASHGIGIGSFVYLRRIFEGLIQKHREELEQQSGPVEGFDGMKIDQKIAALKETLPTALVENKAAYGILSAGIHELDEETCKKYFPIVRQAIIAILEEDLQRREKEKAAQDLRNEIAKISGEIK